jgi:hypothetical protein
LTGWWSYDEDLKRKHQSNLKETFTFSVTNVLPIAGAPPETLTAVICQDMVLLVVARVFVALLLKMFNKFQRSQKIWR